MNHSEKIVAGAKGNYSHLSLLFVLFCISLVLQGCQEEKVKPAVATGIKSDMPAQESWNSKMMFTEDGDLKGILYAAHLSVYPERFETLLETIKLDFYDPDGKKTTTLTSKRGRVDDRTRNMYAIENVVVVSDSGVTLTTEELVWRNKDRKIVTDKFVTIVSPKEKIQGYGFEADQNLKNYVIHNITFVTSNVSGTGIPSEKPAGVSSPGVPDDKPIEIK